MQPGVSAVRALAIALAVTLTVAMGSPPLRAASARPSGLASSSDAPALVETLRNPNASVAQKALACQQLAIVGSPDAVPAIAVYLDHPQLAVHARNALENHPSPTAGDALRDALTRVKGPFLAGVVNSLGARRDPAAVEALVNLARNPASGVATESLLALGRIASPKALTTIQEVAGKADSPPPSKAAAVEACVLAGEILLAEGEASQATALFDHAVKSAAPGPSRLAATRGAILSRGESGIPMLLEQFRSPDPAVRQLGARVAREVSGAAVGKALALELVRSSPGIQVLILGALADRVETGHAPAIEPLANSENVSVRIAALQALGTLGEASSLPLLIHALESAAQDPESPIAEAAADSLGRMGDAETDAALLRILPETAPPVRAQLIAILGYRHAREATPALLTQAADPDPAVGKAAFDALAAVASLEELPQVIETAIHCGDAGVRDRAERALYAICIKQDTAARRSEPLALAFQKTPSVSARATLLQVMAMLGDPAGSRAIARACQDSDPATSDLALRLLVNWPDSSPVPTLLRLFRTTTNDVHRTLALRGIVTLAALRAGETGATSAETVVRPPSAEAIQWLTEANAAVRDQLDEKKLILSGLGDLNCPEGLRLLEPYLADPAVRHDAELAALRAVQKMTGAGDRAAALAILRKIAGASEDPEHRRRAQAAMETGAGAPEAATAPKK